MRVLALDSATGACSAALWQDGVILARRFAAMERGQSEVLVPMVREVLAEAGAAPGLSDIDALGVTVGPGAFTGLRIGLAAARGMALAASRPLVGVTTFEAVVHGLPQEERQGRTMLVAVESRREDIFVQLFDNELIPLEEPVSVRPADLIVPDGPLLIAGDAAARLVSGLEYRGEILVAAGPGFPDAAVVARLVGERGVDPAGAQAPQPFYIRPPDVTLPAPRVR